MDLIRIFAMVCQFNKFLMIFRSLKKKQDKFKEYNLQVPSVASLYYFLEILIMTAMMIFP